MKTEYFLDIPVDVVTYTDITSKVSEYISENKQMTIASVNPQIIVKGQKYPKALEYINNAKYRIPDGIGIVRASKKRGGNITERVTGIELMYALLAEANELGEKIFLYGAKPATVRQAKYNIQKEYPSLEVVGVIDGYTELANKEIIKQINNSGAKFLFVALGFPKQEEWLNKYAKDLNVNILEDVGGSFDVISGNVKRAPQWMQKHHLEWLYRALKSPRHFKRLGIIPVFIWKTWREKRAKGS